MVIFGGDANRLPDLQSGFPSLLSCPYSRKTAPQFYRGHANSGWKAVGVTTQAGRRLASPPNKLLSSWYRRLACMVRSYQPEVLTGPVFCQFKARPKGVSVEVLLVVLLAL